MKKLVENIVLNERIRTDFGDVEELARDIENNGLIEPIVISPDGILICGERRLRAAKLLGWKEIDVVVKEIRDAFHALKLEISENEHRKPFTFSEKLCWASKIAPEISQKASDNKTHKSFATELSKPIRTDALVAEEVGFKNRETYRKAKFIGEHGDEELISRLDNESISVNAAYNQLKDKISEQEKIIEQQSRCIKRYEEDEDATSEAMENLQIALHDSQEEIKALSAKSNNNDGLVQNIIKQAHEERDDALEQLRVAEEKLKMRKEKFANKSGNVVQRMARICGIIASMEDEKQEQAIDILSLAEEQIFALIP